MVGALLCQGHADEAAAVFGHEVDGLGGYVLGGQSQVALILAVLVVNHNHHAACSDFGDSAGYVGKGELEGTGGVWHGDPSILADGGGKGQKGRSGQLRRSRWLGGNPPGTGPDL